MTKKNYEDRPWGSFTVLDEGISHKVKRIKNFDCIELYEKRIKNRTIMQKTHHLI